MTEASALERLLKRDRAIIGAALAALCLLAWIYLVIGAGVGMSAWEMTSVSLFPHRDGMPPSVDGAASGAWSFTDWALIIAMWWVMMIAMMAPSATPTVLLYASVHRQASSREYAQEGLAPTGAFVAGYLLIWFAFSGVATVLQWVFERASLVSAMMMGSQSRWLSAGVLIAAGIYQLSPLKKACLAHCRSPAAFLSRHWKPNTRGALRLGAIHGAYCVGCCWMLMALLFVGGVMNLVWIAALAILVLIEKLLPAGRWVGSVAGVVLICWGIATLRV